VDVDQKRLKIAVHEIGHAVMAVFRGRGVLKVSLKGMDSPNGIDRYHGFTTLEPIDPNSKVTVNDALRSVMISLGGYASEILFYEVCTPGGDDLTTAAKWSETLLQVDEYRNRMATLPVPEPGPLDEIQSLQVRAYIHHMIPESANALAPLGPVIKFLAEELYKREELTGDEVEAHFNSFMQTRLGADQKNRP
jgi:Peptidase family M41